MTAPRNIPQAIDHLDSLVAEIRTHDPDFSPDSFVRGSDGILNELFEFISQSPENSHFALIKLEQFSTFGEAISAIVAKAPEHIAELARHVSKFCSLRRCSISVKIDGNEIRADAPDADDCERLLRVVDQLLIHRNNDTNKPDADNDKK